MSRTRPATAAMTPPSLRGFLEGGGDPATVLEPHLLLELVNAGRDRRLRTERGADSLRGQRTRSCRRGRRRPGRWSARVVFKAWELDACDDPAVYELLERHLSGSQLTEIVQVVERAEWTAIVRQLGRRLAPHRSRAQAGNARRGLPCPSRAC